MGWIFEYETTAKVSPAHSKSLKIIAITYWLPVVVFSFYANFSFEEYRFIGLICIAICTMLGLLVSKIKSGMPFNSWYHEVVLQGVDKLSMSITSLSNADGSRSFWMLPFESYFGISIKFINPACLFFILMHNLE